MPLLKDVLRQAIRHLQMREVPSAERDGEDLIAAALGKSREQLFIEYDAEIDLEALDRCRTLIYRRAAREPLSYILGKTQFAGASIRTDSRGLIPRQETELFVEEFLKNLPEIASEIGLQGGVLRILDLCSGSGCIGIAVKKRFPEHEVTLVDNSPGALALAKENALLNDLEVSLVEADFLSLPSCQRFHVILCNPPYLAEEEWHTLEEEVRGYEPRTALIAGVTGLEFYQKLAVEAPRYLMARGVLCMELGYQQSDSIAVLFGRYPWSEGSFYHDVAKIQRFYSVRCIA